MHCLCGARLASRDPTEKRGLDGVSFTPSAAQHPYANHLTVSCLFQKPKKYPRCQPDPAQPFSSSSHPQTIGLSSRAPDSGRPAVLLVTSRRWEELSFDQQGIPFSTLPVSSQSLPATPKFSRFFSQRASHWLSVAGNRQPDLLDRFLLALLALSAGAPGDHLPWNLETQS
jgi:hypothetical protein